jgi:hypothetical protein
MPIVLNGTSGITTPTVQTGGIATNLYPLVSGTAQASTSGTSIDFTSIPSWVKRITIIYNAVSLSGTAHLLVQLGVGSTPTTSGYSSTTSYVLVGSSGTGGATSTSGYIMYVGSAAYIQFNFYFLYRPTSRNRVVVWKFRYN